MHAMDWSFVKNLETDALLFAHFPKARQVQSDRYHPGSNLYQLGAEAYASTMDASHSKAGEDPFINIIAWAPSVEFASGVLGFDHIPGDRTAILTSPPEALLLEPGVISYAAIRQAAQSGRFGRFHFSNPKAHPERRYWIRVEKLDYCFLGPEEPLCAICIDYRKIRWAMA